MLVLPEAGRPVSRSVTGGRVSRRPLRGFDLAHGDAGERCVGRRSIAGVVGVRRLPIEDHTGTDGEVGHAVDEDEAPGRAVASVGVMRDGAVERQVASADLVEGQARRLPSPRVFTSTR